MQDDRVGTVSSDAPARRTAVSPDNPCPFLRALVADGFIDGHVVALSKLSGTVEAASGEKGLQETLAGLKTYLVALVANGLGPLRLLRSWWSGAELDALRDGPLDKHGSGSRILDRTAQVNETELARLAEFGKDRQDPSGGFERGLTIQDITAYMDANFDRAKGARRWIDRQLMNGEWPILLRIMGKGDGEQRYLSVAEVRTLFVERRLPDRIAERLQSQPVSAPGGGPLRLLGRGALLIVALVGAAIVAIAEFPDQISKIAPPLAQLLPPPLPDRAPTKAAYWLDQNWSTEDRHWFHHASQGTATFPVPYDWFVALEQPGIHLLTQPGLLKDSEYLERFGFLPSPKSVHADQMSLRRFGYLGSSDATSAPPPESAPPPASVPGLRSRPVENFDGLPVGFARLTGIANPATGGHEPDRIGLTCAACHTGSIRYQGVSVRFDGGPGMVELKRLESATGLSILYTLYVPGRFERFATRVLGPEASPAERTKLKRELAMRGDYVRNQKNVLDKAVADKHQNDTEEGFGRLDALNRIGNQVFYTDLADAGLTGFERNLNARDAPVSFPPIWTVPWFLWAQYDASIQQPLVRNAGEALGVSALLNLSPDYPAETLFRSSVAIENLNRIEVMLRGPDLDQNSKGFGGLASPKWPSQIFPDDPLWKIDPARVSSGRALYAEICAECHLGPVDDPVFDKQFPDKSFWSSKHWDPKNAVLNPVQKSAAEMGTDPAQANVLASRKVDVPGFLNIEPADDLGKNCPDIKIPRASSPEMKFSLALMSLVERVNTKWMEDRSLPETERIKLRGPRKNCPNPAREPQYRARPLNGVWATAPYLHNGSVPSLYWLLKPAAERPKQFCIGSRDFDPQQVGYRVVAGEAPKCNKGETLFSATAADGSPINGNSVLGHSLEGTPGPGKPGVIGRTLTGEERYDLIEYLKTL
jgi:hypothetical protein